jgi:hypothetical protein
VGTSELVGITRCVLLGALGGLALACAQRPGLSSDPSAGKGDPGVDASAARLDASIPRVDGSTPDAGAAPDETASPADALDGPADAGAEAAPVVVIENVQVFVDPLDGTDDPSGPGTAAEPFRSVTAALGAIAARRAVPGVSIPSPVITIVNTKGPVNLDSDSGEVFPWPVVDVTITVADPTADAPIVRGFKGQTLLIEPTGTRWRFSHLVIDCNQSMWAIDQRASEAALDHVTIQNCGLHGFLSRGGAITLGPGVVIQNCITPVIVVRGALTVLGGRGADHTSISGNFYSAIQFGPDPEPAGQEPAPTSKVTLDIRGTDIPPDKPDENDIAVDDNNTGIDFRYSDVTANIRGLHATWNEAALSGYPTSLRVRGSYLADNASSAIAIGTSPGTVDLGAPGGQDPGRNVFEVANQGADRNQSGALWFEYGSKGPIAAAGNVFGATDCAVGGTLLVQNHQQMATDPIKVDVVIDDPTAIDLSDCATR